MTGRDIMVAVVPWPTRIEGDAGDPERSGMRADGRLAYMLTVEGDTAAGAQAVSVRKGVTTMTIGPLDADQLRRLGRTLIRKADEHDRLLARLRESDDAFGLRAQTVSLCEMTVHP